MTFSEFCSKNGIITKLLLFIHLNKMALQHVKTKH